MKSDNIIIWDIESTGLFADWDSLLCIGWKRLGSKRVFCPSVHRQRDVTDDKVVLTEMYDILADADMWITHNGKRFDVPFVNARLLYHGMSPLPRVPHVDTYNSIARGGVKVSSRRLGALADFFDLDEQKESLPRSVWRKAKRGSKQAIEMIAKYCVQDIRTTEAIYEKMRPLMIIHPNLANVIDNKKTACPICQKTGTLVKRGNYITRMAIRQRYHCKSCGGWSNAPKAGMVR